MRPLLALLVLLLSFTVSLGQEEIYWPQHEGMSLARWSPDGDYIATWGETPLVRIWNDNDGSLAMELDHSELEWILPGGVVFPQPKFYDLRNVFWSADGQFILTQTIASTQHKLIFHHAWDVDTLANVYSYLLGTDEYSTWRIEKLHKVLQMGTLVASWYRNLMSFTDIEPASPTFGQAVANIDFGELVAWEAGRWNETNDEVLLRLHTGWYTNWRQPCDTCEMYFTLIDADLESSTFGEVLWQFEAVDEASEHIWPNAQGLLAISRTDSVEVWHLDRESERFGMRLVRMEFGEARPYDILYDERNQRLIVVRLAIVEQHRESYRDWERCVVNICEMAVSVWDVDIESLAFGQRLLEFRHPYRLIEDKFEGGYSDVNLVRLNQSARQVHFYTWSSLRKGVVRLNDDVAAYDLVTGDTVEARSKLSEIQLYSETRSVIEDPSIEIEIEFNREYWYWDAVVINPAGNKIMFKLLSNNPPFDVYWLIQNIETGKYFIPPDTWSDSVFQG